MKTVFLLDNVLSKELYLKKHISQQHLFPETVSHLFWIILRLCCQQFSSELFLAEEIVPPKILGCVFCGLSSLIGTLILGRHIAEIFIIFIMLLYFS